MIRDSAPEVADALGRAVWLSPADAAREFPGGVSTRTVQRWVSAGKLRAHRTPSGRVQILRDDLLLFIGATLGPHVVAGQSPVSTVAPVAVPARAPSPLVTDVPTGYKAGRSGGVYPLDRRNLTPRHLAILKAYLENPNLRQSEIALMLGIAQSTVSTHCNRLINDGLLVVESDSGSRRVRTPESVDDASRARLHAMFPEMAA